MCAGAYAGFEIFEEGIFNAAAEGSREIDLLLYVSDDQNTDASKLYCGTTVADHEEVRGYVIYASHNGEIGFRTPTAL